jgi:hypothetical protein
MTAAKPDAAIPEQGFAGEPTVGWLHRDSSAVGRRSKRCIECGQHLADPSSKLCPGCQAYAEHQR